MMQTVLYLLNGAVQLVISILGLIALFSSIKRRMCRIASYAGAAGFFYLVFSLLNFSWFFGMLDSTDYTAINAIFTALIAMLFLVIVHKLTENKKMEHFLTIFLLAVISLIFVFPNFLLIHFLSLLLLLVIFLDLEFFSHDHFRKVGFAGIFYCIISVIFLLLAFMGDSIQWFFIPDIFMVYIFFKFAEHAKVCDKRVKHHQRKMAIPLQVVRFAIFIVAFTIFTMLGTLALHEIGHGLAAKYYGCSYSSIVFQSESYPHTEVECKTSPDETMILLGAIIMTSLFAIVLFATDDGFVKYVGCLILAFGIIIANRDFASLGVSDSILFVLDIAGGTIIIYALLKLIPMYMEQGKMEQGKRVMG